MDPFIADYVPERTKNTCTQPTMRAFWCVICDGPRYLSTNRIVVARTQCIIIINRVKGNNSGGGGKYRE